jgi:hypothetical protein
MCEDGAQGVIRSAFTVLKRCTFTTGVKRSAFVVTKRCAFTMDPVSAREGVRKLPGKMCLPVCMCVCVLS